MASRKMNNTAPRRELEKTPTGIKEFDEITNGCLPKGRPTLVCGAAGCGKTLLAMEFVVRGATEYGEPSIFLAFENMDRFEWSSAYGDADSLEHENHNQEGGALHC
jgi:circadian clock protein KaiC